MARCGAILHGQERGEMGPDTLTEAVVSGGTTRNG
jgi:hypothetical protein